ncbi:MAG: hypothetical protein QOH72_571 [Solirubrobacteraceae bacterium]|jgi:hypothetical protein|nr:hypothetical protein [Solirubrobacteraceae bacterium]
MYAANTYVIRLATADDDLTLRRLAQLDSKPPLQGAVLLGEVRGAPVAALGLTDDRVIADPFVPTANLLAALRMRAKGVRAVERTPALRERLLAAVPRAARRAA